ncbi:peroxisome assembly protein 26-like [Saccoglossus kowalevskii]|uniref:Peroxisome assembly protein 26-like n=1 Tax=Saccoglossus kowalevskii TaxID=10224 RepID=A0ABM0MNE3_SACKO|nr:PREDICTED: peroxisome assembly protein 26-like [Saccoglossus kowalevskii]
MATGIELECRNEFNGVIRKVNKLLMFQNFEDVLCACRDAIVKVERYERLAARSGDPSEDSENSLKYFLSELVESLCILAVQAFAETNRHEEVLPFLKAHYHGVRHFPLKIIQICILMYGHIKNFKMADGVFKEWKKFPRNQASSSYPGILELYIINILLPQMKCNEAVKMADEDAIINTERKIALIRFVKKFEHAINEENRKKVDEQDMKKEVPGAFTEVVKKMGQVVFKFIPLHFTVVKNLSMVAVFLYLILFKTNLDTVSGLEYAKQLLRGVVYLWTSMFAPYHMATVSRKL